MNYKNIQNIQIFVFFYVFHTHEVSYICRFSIPIPGEPVENNGTDRKHLFRSSKY